MSETLTFIRLSKASKEFNVSTEHIVEFLASRGIVISKDPNTKVGGEGYELLLQEYQLERELKDEAKKITDSRIKKDATVVVDSHAQAVKPRVPEEKKDFLIKETVITKKKAEEEKPVEKKEEKEVIRAKAKIEGPKIIDKIEVGETEEAKRASKKKKKDEEKEEEIKDAKKKSSKKNPADEPVAEAKAEVPPVASTPAPEQITDLQSAEELYRIKREKFAGPVIRGKIELPAEPERKKAAPEAGGDEAKRKRKRKDKKKVDVKKEITTGRFERPFRSGQSQRRARPAEKGPTEITSKDIDERIRQTLNRLKGGSRKTSKAARLRNIASEAEEAASDVQTSQRKTIKVTEFVTVSGHVDHGKTSLLDHIRKANVIAGEAGGITQHIGAYEVTLENGKAITFLDTPGHEAFTAMRARGAKVTDVAIIVIAADDSVMPQTIEAINHAQAAAVPIVFAINKTDKPEANSERIREQLSKMNILVEDWGGKFQSQEISAKTGKNVDLLLEKVLLEADILDLKANPNRNAGGTIIEAALDKGRGYITTILVQRGTLKAGDVVLAGCHSGRVKAMFNERNQRIKEAGPSVPAQMLGLDGAPQAGDLFTVMDDEREAREIATRRLQLQREQGIRTTKHITLDEIGRRLAVGNFKELNLIVKGDVDGSIEALTDQLLKLTNPQIQVNVIHKSVGQITESDVLLASASNAVIIGFQVRPSLNARKLAEKEQIDIRLYSIIYNAINGVKDAITGMLAPEYEEKIVCNIEARELFKISKRGTIAGFMVLDGKITRNTKVRIIRDGIVAFTGELASLKRFKDDVKEVAAGYECGLGILNFNDIKTGDIIEGYEQVLVPRK